MLELKEKLTINYFPLKKLKCWQIFHSRKFANYFVVKNVQHIQFVYLNLENLIEILNSSYWK